MVGNEALSRLDVTQSQLIEVIGQVNAWLNQSELCSVQRHREHKRSAQLNVPAQQLQRDM